MATGKPQFNASRRRNADRYRFFHNISNDLTKSNFKKITTPISYFNVISQSIKQKKVGILGKDINEKKRIELQNKLRHVYALSSPEIRKEYNEYQKDHYIGSLNYEYDQASQYVNNFERTWWNGRTNIRPLNFNNNIMVAKKHILQEEDDNKHDKSNLGEPMLANEGMAHNQLSSIRLAHDCYNIFYKFPKQKSYNVDINKNDYLYFYTNYVFEAKSIYYLTELDFMGVLRQLDFNYERQYDTDIDHVIYKFPYKSYNDFGLVGKGDWSNEDTKLDVLDGFKTGESKSCPFPIYDGMLGHPFYLKKEWGIMESRLAKEDNVTNEYKKYPVVFHEGESGNIYLYYKKLKNPDKKFGRLKKYLFDIRTHIEDTEVIDTRIDGLKEYSRSDPSQYGGSIPFKFSNERDSELNFDSDYQFISIPSPPHGIFDPRTATQQEYDKTMNNNISAKYINNVDNAYLMSFYRNYKYKTYPYARENTGFYGLDYIEKNRNRGVYSNNDLNPVKFLNRNGRNNRFAISMNVSHSYANYIKNMRECMLVFINKFGTNRGGYTLTEKDSITKKYVEDFINYRRDKGFDTIDLKNLNDEVDYYCENILRRMRELIYPSFIEDRDVSPKLFNSVDLLADVSSPLMWYHNNKNSYLYVDYVEDETNKIQIKTANSMDNRLLTNKSQDILLNYYLGVCRDMIKINFDETSSSYGNDENSMYKKMENGRRIYYGLNLARDIVGRVLFDYPNHPSSGFRHFNIKYHESLDFDLELLKKYTKNKDITNFGSYESYDYLPLLKNFLNNYFKTRTLAKDSSPYDMFTQNLQEKYSSNLNLSNFLGRQYRLLNVSTSDILASRKNVNDNDVTNVTRVSSTGPYGKKITVTDPKTSKTTPFPIPMDDFSKYYSNYSIDGSPNFGTIISLAKVMMSRLVTQENKYPDHLDEYDIGNIMNIYVGIYIDNISKRIFIFEPSVNMKTSKTISVVMDELTNKYGFRVADKSCFSCGKLKPQFRDDHNSYGKKYNNLNFDTPHFDENTNKIYMTYSAENNKANNVKFSEDYLYEVICNENSYLYYNTDNLNHMRLANKLTEKIFLYNEKETFFPLKTSSLSGNQLKPSDYLVRLIDLSGIYCLLFLVVMTYNISVPHIEYKESETGIDTEKEFVADTPILSFDNPFEKAFNYILPVWDTSYEKISGRMKKEKIPSLIFEELLKDFGDERWDADKLETIYNKIEQEPDFRYIRNYIQDVQKIADLIGSTFFENWTVHYREEFNKYQRIFADEIYDITEVLKASNTQFVEEI